MSKVWGDTPILIYFTFFFTALSTCDRNNVALNLKNTTIWFPLNKFSEPRQKKEVLLSY